MADGTSPEHVATAEPARSGRASGGIAGGWGAVTGILPHLLHHAGVLGGVSLIAGVTGRAVFGAVGLVLVVPFLVRLRRRFRSWVAPAAALLAFVALFALSSFVIGPLVTGDSERNERHPGMEHHGS